MHENLHRHVLCTFLFFNSSAVRSEIQTIKTSSDDRSFILFQDFGFNSQGFISLAVSSVSVTAAKSIVRPTKLSVVGCLYAPSRARRAMKFALLRDVCIIGKPFIFPIFTFNEKTILSESFFNKTIPVTVPDLYYIFFVNCAKNSSVSMTVNLETYNVRPNGDFDYIDEHFNSLPITLSIFALLFLGFLLTWSYACHKSKPFVHKIHMLMAVLLFLRFLELIFYAKRQHSIRLTGSPHAWNVLWLTTYVARNMLFITVIILIGAGWSRRYLQHQRKHTVAVALSLQVLACICFILIHEFGPSDKHYRHWIVTCYAVDFLCCITMTVPVHKSMDIFGINLLRKEARRVIQERVFGNFAVVVYVYVGFTRLGLFVLRTMTSHELWCLTIALELSVELLFYVLVYLMVWPNERYDYAVLENTKEESSSATLHGGSWTGV